MRMCWFYNLLLAWSACCKGLGLSYGCILFSNPKHLLAFKIKFKWNEELEDHKMICRANANCRARFYFSVCLSPNTTRLHIRSTLPIFKKGFKESDLWHCVITHNICFSVFLKMSLNPLVFSVLTRVYDMSLFLCPLLGLHYGATVLRCFCNHVPKWNLTACKIFVRVYPVNQHYINKMRWHGDAVLALWPAATNSWVWIHRPALAFLRRAYMFSLCLCRFSPGTLAFPYSPKTCLLG